MKQQQLQRIVLQTAAAKAAAAGDAEAYAAARRLLDANRQGVTFHLRPKAVTL